MSANRKLVPTARALMGSGDASDLGFVEREVVVRAPEGTGIIFGAALLAALQKTLPVARLRFIPKRNSDAMVLREGRIDLDLGTLHDCGPEIQTSLLHTQRFVGAVRTGHALTTGRVTVKRFAAERHVALSQREHGKGGAREPLVALLLEAACTHRVVPTVPSADAALMAAACLVWSHVCPSAWPERLVRLIGPSDWPRVWPPACVCKSSSLASICRSSTCCKPATRVSMPTRRAEHCVPV